MFSFKMMLRLYKPRMVMLRLTNLNVALSSLPANKFLFSRQLSMEKPKPFDVSVINKSLIYQRNKQQDAINNNEKRTLLLLFAWMFARDNHLHKYIQLYEPYKFDVLIVKTSLKQLLFPKNGSVATAKQVCDFILEHKNRYSNIVVHGFSVGGYQFGEVLVQMSANEDYKNAIAPLVRGCIFDSAVDSNTIPSGLSKAMTKNAILRRMVFILAALYLRVFYLVATVYYKRSHAEFLEMKHFRAQFLLIVSDIDRIGSIEANQPLADIWNAQGSPSKMKIFKESKHVSHFYKYREEYVQELNQFIEQLKLC